MNLKVNFDEYVPCASVPIESALVTVQIVDSAARMLCVPKTDFYYLLEAVG